MNIMQLVEGKKYKDQEGNEWNVDESGIFDECSEELTNYYDSKQIRNMTFTEVKEPITITLEAEELEHIKMLLDRPYSANAKIGEKILEKLK